ncbi:hypothetical protein ACFWXB_02950 [Tsukamurella tyrosinosolvens]|uniref:hypothetical protein n=1 Tax=Tsukamurella tyrosinosolvens TaxID=57704 RepID=UPI003689149C
MTDIPTSRPRVNGASCAAQYATAGADHAPLEDTDSIADASGAASPIGTPYEQLAGPFYDTAGLTRWLGLSEQALAKRVATGTVIACRQEDDRRTWLYPAWQFTDHALIPGLADVWQILREGATADLWVAVFWLKAPHPKLGCVSPIDWLHTGRELDVVINETRADAARWTACPA